MNQSFRKWLQKAGAAIAITATLDVASSALQFVPTSHDVPIICDLKTVPRCNPHDALRKSLMIPPVQADKAVLRYVRELAKRLAREDHEAEVAAHRTIVVSEDT